MILRSTVVSCIVLAVLFSLIPVISIAAQQGGASSSVSTSSVSTGLSGISLTPAQEQQLAAIKKEYSSRYKAFTTGLSADIKEGKRASLSVSEKATLRSISQEQLSQVRQLLTSEQRSKFDSNISYMEANASSIERPSRIVSRDSTIATLVPIPRSKTARNSSKNVEGEQ